MHKLMYLLPILLLVGCGTTGKDVRTDLVIKDNNGCVINIYPTVSTDSGDSVADSANDTNFKDLVKLPPVEEIMDAAINKGVNTELLKDLIPKVGGDTVVEPKEPVVEEPTTGETTIEPDPIGDIIEGVGKNTRIGLQAGRTETMGKAFNWLPKTGSSYSSPLIVAFPQCNAQMVIKDPSNAYGADGNSGNTNQMYYFSGNPEKQRDINPGCPGGCASIFAPPGCPATYAIINQ